MLAEAVEVIRLLWSGERVSYAGRWYRLEQARAEPTPVRGWLSIGVTATPACASPQHMPTNGARRVPRQRSCPGG